MSGEPRYLSMTMSGRCADCGKASRNLEADHFYTVEVYDARTDELLETRIVCEECNKKYTE